MKGPNLRLEVVGDQRIWEETPTSAPEHIS